MEVGVLMKNGFAQIVWISICIFIFGIVFVNLEDASAITWIVAMFATFYFLRMIYRKWIYQMIYGDKWHPEVRER